MNKNVLSVAAALVVCSSASASLVSVNIIAGPNQHPDGLHNTWQVVARFSNALDQISAVNGLPDAGLNNLVFFTGDGSDIYNQGLFAGLPFNDFPSTALGGEAFDSYVTIGATDFPHNTQFTPDFLGDWGGAQPPVQVILGSSFTEDDGAWFFFGAPPEVGNLEDAEGGNNTFDVVVAQFTVDQGVGFHLEGNVAWLNPAAGSNNDPFVVDNIVPAPGALALLGLAGLAGTRRRRR